MGITITGFIIWKIMVQLVEINLFHFFISLAFLFTISTTIMFFSFLVCENFGVNRDFLISKKTKINFFDYHKNFCHPIRKNGTLLRTVMPKILPSNIVIDGRVISLSSSQDGMTHIQIMIENAKIQNALFNSGQRSIFLQQACNNIEMCVITLPTHIGVKHLIPGNILTAIPFYYVNSNKNVGSMTKDYHPITGVAVGGRDVRLGTRDTHSAFVAPGTQVIHGVPSSTITFRRSKQTVNPLHDMINRAKPHLSSYEKQYYDSVLDVYYTEISSRRAAEMALNHSLPFVPNYTSFVNSTQATRFSNLGSDVVSDLYTHTTINSGYVQGLPIYTGNKIFIHHAATNNKADRMLNTLKAALAPLLPKDAGYNERLADIQKNVFDETGVIYPGVKGNSAEVTDMERGMAIIDSRIFEPFKRALASNFPPIAHTQFTLAGTAIPGAKMEIFKNGMDDKQFVIGYDSRTSAQLGDQVAITSYACGVVDKTTGNVIGTHLVVIKSSVRDLPLITKTLNSASQPHLTTGNTCIANHLAEAILKMNDVK